MTLLLPLITSLLACPSITPDDAGCQNIISKRLAMYDFNVEEMNINDVKNIWLRYGDKGPLFVFVGHTDVVPTGPVNDWTSPPFQPTERDGYLFGRGVADMKGAIAAMVIAIEKFITVHPHFPGSIGLLLTSDEEGPAVDGTRKVVEKLIARNEKIDYCIIGEPSSNQQLGDQIRVGRRGSLHGDLTIHGVQGHVAHPHRAENPIHKSLLTLHELAQVTWDEGSTEFPPTTFQITNINAGTGALNVIPGHLNVIFNFRFGNATTIESLKQRTKALLALQGLKYDLHWEVGADPFLTHQGKLIQATKEAIHNVTGLDTVLSTGGGTSDGRFIAPTGAEVVELGVSNATAHHVNECVKTKDLEELTKIYYRILENIFLS